MVAAAATRTIEKRILIEVWWAEEKKVKNGLKSV